MKKTIRILINRKSIDLEVEPNQTLLEVIRETLGLTGTKAGCLVGDCGACTVLVDGAPVNSCLMLALQANGKEITTIEGVETPQGLHPLQSAFVDKGAIQCGYCTPGMILTAKSLLDHHSRADEAEVRKAISGNLCRCTGYQKIVEAILYASRISP
ncbi:MAG: (2Fe-2S)-binding protein [Desulfobacterota bacterium]|jgi:carbon-monoxide dehydrogenase small subunit|nr:(2Fe-2S)-binding protein [Thermodesulfobacteriota bacterium]